MKDRFERKLIENDYIVFIRTYNDSAQLVPAKILKIEDDIIHAVALSWDKRSAKLVKLISPKRTLRISEEFLTLHEYKLLNGNKVEPYFK